MSVSFDRWFQQQGQRPAANELDLPDGLHLRDGKVMATCRVCECEYEWDVEPEGFTQEMSYCGRNPRCLP